MSSHHDELTLEADAAEVGRASEWLEAMCRQRGAPQPVADRLALSLHEMLANVIAHGGTSARSSPIGIHLEVVRDKTGGEAGGEVRVTVSDGGIAFNPLMVAEIARPNSLAEAVPEGRGLTMIRRFSDWLDYRHEGGRNHLTFGARWIAKVKPPGTTHFHRSGERRVASHPVMQERRRGLRRGESFRWIALFADADPVELDAALADCELLMLSAGETLLRLGDLNQSVFILLSGKLTAYLSEAPDPDNGIEISASECFGELSAIDGKPISALVVAATDVRVLKLDKEVFWKRLIKLRGVAENMMITLSERMRRSNVKALAMQREQLELQHLRKELDVARQLQASMLPLQRPLFPGRTDIEVCGFMEPASKVGGDLFDAFFVDNRTLFVCVGDVSGHGIAAALFMVRVIGLLRILAMESTQPEKILETLNDRLCIGNDTNLFVTLFCGFLDTQSGHFVYSNAGHCPPLVCSERWAAPLPLPKGMLAGAASGRQYASLERHLAVGETLLCYTDGMSEAENPSGVQFSEQGCLTLLKHGAARALPELLDSMYEEVVIYTGSPHPADDCTMLAVRRLALNQ